MMTFLCTNVPSGVFVERVGFYAATTHRGCSCSDRSAEDSPRSGRTRQDCCSSR